jgi:hypothetical protein
LSAAVSSGSLTGDLSAISSIVDSVPLRLPLACGDDISERLPVVVSSDSLADDLSAAAASSSSGIVLAVPVPLSPRCGDGLIVVSSPEEVGVVLSPRPPVENDDVFVLPPPC